MNFLIKKLLAPRGMEYLVINRDLIIEDMSYGVKRFADCAAAVENGQDVRTGFPELIGMENVLMQVLCGWKSSLELKGIFRQNNPTNPPLYMDLYMMGTQDQPSIVNTNLMVVFEDVTDRMILEQTLTQRSHEAALLLNSLTATRDYLQKIITAIADALIVTTRSGIIKTINPAAQELFGYTAEALVDRSISTIMIGTGDSQGDAFRRALTDNFPQTSPQNLVVNCQKQDNSIVTVAFSCSTIQTEVDGIENLVYIGRDITEHLQIKENLKLARLKAEEASQSKSLFLANMSHEIRTPMNGVLGLTELLFSTDLDPRQRDFIEGIRTSGRNLLTIINEILDLSKLEAGEVRAEVYEFDLWNCVEDVVDLLAPLAQSKKLELACIIDPNLPMAVMGDGGRLRQILTNFLSNAIKFTPTGEILVEVTPHPEGIMFAVTDRGIGIAPETLSKLFSPFTQADNSTTRKYGGTGLGLAICKQLAKLMGGKIGAGSAVGEGSRFWVSLPFDLGTDPESDLIADFEDPDFEDLGGDRSGHSSIDSNLPLNGYRLLVVDRHANTQRAISTYVQHLGMKAIATSSKQQALAILQSSDKSNNESSEKFIDIDLVIIEQELADTDFTDNLAHNLPLIITTSIALATNPVTNKNAAGTSSIGIAPKGITYLAKPIRLSRLRQTIQTIINTNLKVKQLSQQIDIDPNPIQPQKVLNILLAEDNAINQKVAITLLNNLGHKVDIAGNGEEVLQLATVNAYDLILMDCQMPILDGFATTAEIRRREASDRHTIIIAVTANAMKEDRERCLAAGMDDYLSKPFYKTEIEAILNKWGNA